MQSFVETTPRRGDGLEGHSTRLVVGVVVIRLSGAWTVIFFLADDVASLD